MNRRLVALALVFLVPVIAAQAPDGSNQPPIAAFEYSPAAPEIFDDIAFSSTATDPDGLVIGWSWDFGDGTTAAGPNVTHAYERPGTFSVILTVYDDQGAAAQIGRSLDIYGPALPNWLAWSMPMLVGFLLLGLAYIVLAKGQPNIYNRVFFAFYCTSAFKSFTEAGLVLLADPRQQLHTVLLQLNLLSAFLLVSLFLWFVLVFPRPVFAWLREGRRGAWTLILVVPLALLTLIGPLEYADIQDIFNVYASLIGLAALGLLVYHAWETDSDEERRRIRMLSVTFILLVFSTLLVTFLNILYRYFHGIGDEARAYNFLYLTAFAGVILTPILELIGAAVLMFAILRYQLLGIDRFVVRLTRASLGAIVVPLIFLIISNLLEELFAARLLAGVQLSFLISGVIAAILMIPLQKLFNFAANRFFPGWSRRDEEQLSRRRIEIFEAQLRYSLLDNKLRPKEVMLLERLSASLELTDQEMDDVVQRFGPDVQENIRTALIPAEVSSTKPAPDANSAERRPAI